MTRRIESPFLDGQEIAQGKRSDRNEILRALRFILEPGQVTELRALDAVGLGERRPVTISGYFDNPEMLVEAVEKIETAKGIYFIPNRISPALLARACNRARSIFRDPTTADHDIQRRLWLLIDVDPVRPAGISSTIAEYNAAFAVAEQIKAHLHALGWHEPITATSGNGMHLLYRIDLPPDDGGLVERCLQALARRFNTAAVQIDQQVCNPARIWKLYGTFACKGDSTPERPHQLARILDAPQTLAPVSLQFLDALAAEPAAAPARSAVPRPLGRSFDIARWIADHRLEVIGPESWKDGQRWVFPVCPWNSAHNDRSAYIIRHGSGAIGAGCHHNGCNGKTWHDLRQLIEANEASTLAGGSRHNSLNSLSSQPPMAASQEDSWPEPLKDSALYGIAGQVVHAIAPHTEADPVALLVQFLVAFGNLLGRGCHWLVNGDEHHGNLFVVLVGTSSKGRKGTSWGLVFKLFELISQLIRDSWTANCVKSGLSSAEGLIWQVRDPVDKLVGGKAERIDDGALDKRLLVLEPEFSQVLKQTERAGNTLSPVIRQAWERGSLSTLTKNSTNKATDAHVSIVAHITKEELLRNLSDTEIANGFGNRFLWTLVRRSKLLPDGGGTPPLQSLAQSVTEALLTFKGKRLCLRRDEEANALWQQAYEGLTAEQDGLAAAVCGRAEAQAMRLAMLYALLDRSEEIRREHLQAGLALWDYCEQSARCLFGNKLGDPTADEINEALKKQPMGMSRTEISACFGRHRRSGDISRALSVLLRKGLARLVMVQTNGRPEEHWHTTS